jgi:epoxyqueuosine reductase
VSAEADATPRLLAERLKALALAVGFDLAGIAPALPTPETERLRDWLARGFAGEMHYIGRRVEERVDPRRLLAGARSVLAVGLVYDAPGAFAPSGSGPRISRYAGGTDYHELLLDRLRAVEAALPALAGRPVASRAYVDTGPVQERSFAALAGLGWIGKNACLIHPRLGSYLFLGVLISDLELAADARGIDHCGSCRACLDACPTDAFAEPGVLDARRCIAYTTIETRDEIPRALREGQGAWIFGCDICQEVCPWNQRSLRRIPTEHAELRAQLAPRSEWLAPTLAWLLSLSEDAWRAATRHSALRRSRYRGLLRNALVAAGNIAGDELLTLVRPHASSDDPLLAEHARWAIERIEARSAERAART